MVWGTLKEIYQWGFLFVCFVVLVFFNLVELVEEKCLSSCGGPISFLEKEKQASG